MKIENLPENPTTGVVRRTLRGMDGRIRQVETLAARWSPKRIDDAIAAALAPVLAQMKTLVEDFEVMTKEFAAFTEAQVPPVVEPDAVVEPEPDATGLGRNERTRPRLWGPLTKRDEVSPRAREGEMDREEVEAAARYVRETFAIHQQRERERVEALRQDNVIPHEEK